MSDAVPTRVRYRVIGVCSLMGVLLYLDRFCVSFAEAFIKEDLGLSATDISLMFVFFFLSYALGQTPAGWLADRFGGRRMLTLYILFWSLFTGLLGLATGVAVLAVLRLGMGFAQAGAFPTAANMISKWVPLQQRGVASSVVALGGRIGGVLSLFITGYVILFFVPTSVDSKFTASDLLRADRLCYEFTFGSLPVTADEGDGGLPGRLGQRIRLRFPEELQAKIETVASGYRVQSRQTERDKLPPRPDATPNDFRQELTAGLNQLLAVPEFFALEELRDVKLEREASRLLNSERSKLSPSQVERMNRLVLESVYPASIKKVYGLGWRKMTFLYGLIGLPMALLFWVVCRDDPRRHPRCNVAELALIEANRVAADQSAKVGRLPLMELATNRSMWFNGAMQFFTNVGWVFLLTYLPRYLIEIHHVPLAERAKMSMIPTFVAIFGMFLGGFLTDRMAVVMGRRWGRSLPIAVTRFAAGAAYLVCLLQPSPWTAIALLSVTAFMCDLGIPAVWAFQQDVGGKHTGSVLGWGNMWGNFGAAAGSYLIGWLIDLQLWNVMFLTCAGAFVVSGLVALGVDATKKIVPDDAPSD